MKFPLRGDRGSALLELALTAPLFVTLMMGAIELGRVAYYSIEVVNAARAGASYGSVNYGNAFSTSGQADTVQAAKNDAPDVSSLTVTNPLTYCVCETLTPSSGSATFSGVKSCLDPTITSCTTESGTTQQYIIDYVKVDTQTTIDPLIHLPGLPTTYTLRASSRLRVLQN
ncbi:MAG TPA: TadE/TadG family type IV pilus assembly protein [Terracidiphilus sp.]|nr:TadE/TadG family type IV pilus assembly protein [Terracidiphilus sp.]